jgi:hypothetical protein
LKTDLIAALNKLAAHILHGTPTGASCKELLMLFRIAEIDHNQEAAFLSQLFREPLQEFLAAFNHLAGYTHAGQPKHIISKEAAMPSPTGEENEA